MTWLEMMRGDCGSCGRQVAQKADICEGVIVCPSCDNPVVSLRSVQVNVEALEREIERVTVAAVKRMLRGDK